MKVSLNSKLLAGMPEKRGLGGKDGVAVTYFISALVNFVLTMSIHHRNKITFLSKKSKK